MCRTRSFLFANGIGFSFWTWNMNFFFIWFRVYFDELDILYDELNSVLTKWDRSWIMVHGLFWWFIEPNFLCFGTHSTPAWPLLTCNSHRTRVILFDFSSSYVKIWFSKLQFSRLIFKTLIFKILVFFFKFNLQNSNFQI